MHKLSPEQLAEIHKKECELVLGRDWCGYECQECGLCVKASHWHIAGNCLCHPSKNSLTDQQLIKLANHYSKVVRSIKAKCTHSETTDNGGHRYCKFCGEHLGDPCLKCGNLKRSFMEKCKECGQW